MINSSITAKSVSLEDTKPVSLSEIYERVMRGEIIVVSKCLQAIDYFSQLKEASLEGIRQVAGEEKAARVKEAGFEAIHKIIDVEELDSVYQSTYEVFRSLAPELSRRLVQQLFPSKKYFYFEEYPNVRFHVPYDVVIRRKEEFSQFHWNGKVTAHGPHHDSWYCCPINGINIWFAIGAVKMGNGLTVYPQAYGKYFPCTKEGKILRNQYFGQALSFELAPGDAIIFQGEHLHGSEINSTDATRYVASVRMTLEKPHFLGHSPYKENYIYAECHDGFAAKINQFLANNFRLWAKQSKSFFNKGKEVSHVVSQSEIKVFDDTSPNLPQIILIKNFEKDRLTFDPSDLPIGTIKPLSEKLCITRLDVDRVVVFSRYCPHEGADLAAGYLRDGYIVCPWHNLPLSLENGTSPCKSLPQLTVIDYVQSSGTDDWQTTNACNHHLKNQR